MKVTSSITSGTASFVASRLVLVLAPRCKWGNFVAKLLLPAQQAAVSLGFLSKVRDTRLEFQPESAFPNDGRLVDSSPSIIGVTVPVRSELESTESGTDESLASVLDCVVFLSPSIHLNEKRCQVQPVKPAMGGCELGNRLLPTACCPHSK